jgi:protein-S-isoprenylcysteine O-methyltransferase Ste14
MEFLGQLQVGWLNGWLMLVILYALFGILMIVFPREVVKRLYDRTGWTRRDYVRRMFAVPIALSTIGLFVFLPLKTGIPAFWIGLAIYGTGLVVFNTALFNYRSTPLDQPVTRGIYRFSRNPQQIGLLLAFLGTSFAVGSWLLVGAMVLMGFSAHARVLAEERGCLKQYGDAHQEYMNRIPRYFGVPNRTGSGRS